jgi:hypothetical protein
MEFWVGELARCDEIGSGSGMYRVMGRVISLLGTGRSRMWVHCQGWHASRIKGKAAGVFVG